MKQSFRAVLVISLLAYLGCAKEPTSPRASCDFEIIADYLERRSTIPLFDREQEALAAILASCGKRDELFMIHDEEGRLMCIVLDADQRARMRELACPDDPCSRLDLLEGLHDRQHDIAPICEASLHAALESLGIGPAATILARDVAIRYRWLDLGEILDGPLLSEHPRELRRQTGEAYSVVRSLRDKPDLEHMMRLHRNDDFTGSWIVKGRPGSMTVSLHPGDGAEIRVTSPEIDVREVDLLVDDDVPWTIVEALLRWLLARHPDGSFGLVFLGARDAPALVRLPVSAAAHYLDHALTMSCDGTYRRVPETRELEFFGDAPFGDVASMLECMCPSIGCADGISLHDLRVRTQPPTPP